MVDSTAVDRAGADLVQHLCVVGRTPERELLCAAVPVAVLLTVPGQQLRAPNAAAVRLVVEPVASLPGARHSARIPRDLLLLPRVLPLVFLVTAGVRGAGCSNKVQR